MPRDQGGRWLAGVSPNPGGRKRPLVEIERMLDENHRNVDALRPVFDRLRALAMGEIVEVEHKGFGVVVELRADAAFMKLYLDRLLGPSSDEAAIDGKVEARLRQLLELAEAMRDAAKARAPVVDAKEVG